MPSTPPAEERTNIHWPGPTTSVRITRTVAAPVQCSVWLVGTSRQTPFEPRTLVRSNAPQALVPFHQPLAADHVSVTVVIVDEDAHTFARVEHRQRLLVERIVAVIPRVTAPPASVEIAPETRQRQVRDRRWHDSPRAD